MSTSILDQTFSVRPSELAPTGLVCLIDSILYGPRAVEFLTESGLEIEWIMKVSKDEMPRREVRIRHLKLIANFLYPKRNPIRALNRVSRQSRIVIKNEKGQRSIDWEATPASA